MEDAPRALVAGTMVGTRYEVVRAIGRGSFGHTFVARDRESGRMVAIKALDARSDLGLKSQELFAREEAVLRSLRHQGVPEVFELMIAPWEGRPTSFLVMELIEGESLAEIIASQRQLDPEMVLHLFLSLLDVLEYLHGRVPPIVHRDIKPSNIIVRPDGNASLVDFGSVRRVFLPAGEGGSTIVGTYGYMPFEQYMGQATPASDLYSLAATFLHLLTGRPPSAFMTEAGQLEVPAELPGDPRLGPIIARLLRASPAERYASARDVRLALLSPNVLQRVVTVTSVATRVSSVSLALGPVPRPIEGALATLLDRLSPGALELMDAGRKPSDTVGVGDWITLALTSLVTVGIMPLVFVYIARERRKRLLRFLRNGLPAAAEITGMDVETIGFEVKLSKVSYEFHVDGVSHRDADRVLPIAADRWRVGDQIEILYLPDQEFDSVIVSG
jgi:serine/threonine protein kinase